MTTGGGDVDLAAVGALVADRRRCQILLALNDRRDSSRAVLITDTGHEGLRTTFGIELS